MQFKNIIGQTSAKTQLTNLIRSGRMPHSMLFVGPEGSGKLSLALAAAQYLLCKDQKEDDACGVCSNCVKASKRVHPDIHFSFPFVGSKMTSNNYLPEWRNALTENPYMNINQWLMLIGAENKQGNITALECQEIVKKLSLKSFEAEWKVLIIWRPEYLGKEGNRLLKLIEEPPEKTIFILVAENLEKILNTILSRCQLIKIPALDDEALSEGIQYVKQIPVEKAEAIMQLANGNFNEALTLADSAENDNKVMFLDWMRKCFKGDGPALLRWVEAFAKIGRENQKYFFQYALHFIREMLMIKMTSGQHIRLQENEKLTAERMAKIIGFNQIEQITDVFNDSIYFIERNAHPKILFMDTSLKMHEILKPVVGAK